MGAGWIEKTISRISVRSVLIIVLALGSLHLAIIDEKCRPIFGDLAKIGIGGYLGQLLPHRRDAP